MLGRILERLAGNRPAAPRDGSALPARSRFERRWVIVAAAVALFGVLFGLRQFSTETEDSLALLYVIPIALLALEFGVVGGIAAALFAVGLMLVWLATSTANLGLMGVLARACAFAVVGGVAGQFSDRMRGANARQRALLHSGLALAHLEAAGDLAATIAAEAMRVAGATRVQVEVTGGDRAQLGAETAMHEVSLPIVLRGEELASAVIGTRRKLTGDDLVALDMVALQAALAADNQRLLARERERAIMRAELRSAQAQLVERGDQLEALVTRHEAERGALARELHDEAAQVLAAVLLDLKGLERQFDREHATERWQVVRSNIDATLQSLRSLAVSLRPPILRLGLQAALEDLASTARARGFGRFVLDIDAAGPLTPELETTIYRIVEELLDAVGPAREVAVVAERTLSVQVRVVAPERTIGHERLTVLKARLGIAGGTVTTDDDELRVSIPLAQLDAVER